MKKAQQLVEFALVLPILMIIVMVIIELGFAINARITLADAIKMSIGQINQSYNSADNQTTKQALLENSLTNTMVNYFSLHNMPYANTINVQILPGSSGSQTSLVVANYTYTPIFTLPNIFGGQIIPSNLTFSSFQVVNNALLMGNQYPNPSNYFNTKDLSSFKADSTSSDPRTSILKGDGDNGGSLDSISIPNIKQGIGFLVNFQPRGTDQFQAPASSSDTFARLFNWWGEDLLPVYEVCDITTGNIVVRSPYYNGGKWFDTGIPYSWILISLGFNQANYTQYDNIPYFQDNKLSLSSSTLNAGLPWCNQPNASYNYGSCSGDISTSDIDNLNKRGMSFLFSSGGSASGTYDNITDSSNTYNKIYSYSLKGFNLSPSCSYYLKLYIPNNVIPAIANHMVANYFKVKFSIDVNGVLTTGSAMDITSAYIDSNGNGIPDAWDNNPSYPDADANAVFDGSQASIGALVTNAIIPDIYNFNCATYNTTYISTPYDLNGNLNSPGNTFAPSLFSVNYISNEIYNSNSYNAIYYCNGANTRRSMVVLTSINDKAKFFNGIVVGGMLDPNTPIEANLAVYYQAGTNVFP